jgi:ABC-type branched-subunit amino acid transport system substrate-binding protein
MLAQRHALDLRYGGTGLSDGRRPDRTRRRHLVFHSRRLLFGNSLQDDTAAIVKAKDGKILGDTAMPLGTSDYASALLSAQISGAKVIALALAGQDLLSCVKQAAEIGIGRGHQKIEALIVHW